MIIDENELTLYLQQNKITKEFSVDELTSLVNMVLAKITSETGLELISTPHQDTEFYSKPNNGYYHTMYYPVESIESILVDTLPIPETDYICDNVNGVIKFLKPLPGYYDVLYVNYRSKETDTWINSNLKSLIMDMVLYSCQDSLIRDASSIKEGDVSINLNTNTGLGADITKRLDTLRNNKAKTRML